MLRVGAFKVSILPVFSLAGTSGASISALVSTFLCNCTALSPTSGSVVVIVEAVAISSAFVSTK